MRRFTLIAIACLPALSMADVDPEELAALEANLPVVSAASIRAATNAPEPAVVTPVADVGNPSGGPRVITVRPGINEIIPISVGHPNRIVTPFGNPVIRTTSNASFDVEGGTFYVTSSDEGQPVTAFITEKGNTDVALSVTLVPKRIPPVEVTLRVDEQEYPGWRGTNAVAQRWEESHPYLTTIREVLRSVATGTLPQGYSMHSAASLPNFYGCQQPGLTFNFSNGQSIDGHQLRVVVGVVENTSDQEIEFREPSCAGPSVKAVTSWPLSLLKPGERSEIFVVQGIDTPAAAPTYNARSSLLGN